VTTTGRRLPIVPTVVVGIAVMLMIGLGVWQLYRLQSKEALLARIAANPSLPEMTLLPHSTDQSLLLRRGRIDCAAPLSIATEGAGKSGSRFIATCANGAKIQIGTSPDPQAHPVWNGAIVRGTVWQAPDHRIALVRWFEGRATELMLVPETPLAGLSPNAPPDPGSIPNNHFAYAMQWFLFAATALVIYVLAVAKRLAGGPAQR
jgi:surfeit locus 1 family protein